MASLPKYEALAQLLESNISDGVFQYGSKLPSENDLAEQYQMSRQTVRQAIAKLENAGLVERRRGSGTYVNLTQLGVRSSMNVAIITTYIDEYIFPSILRGMEWVLSQNGYSPLLMPTYNRVEEERRILLSCLNKDVDGLIVEGTQTALPNPNLDLYQELLDKGLPVVFINGYYRQMKMPIYVVADDVGGGRQAVEYMIKKGYKRLAGIFKSDDIQGHDRYAGFMRALIDNDQPLLAERMFWYTTETKESVFSPQMFQTLQDCDGVICYNDEIAIQLEVLLRAKGHKVPEELAILSFDNSVYSEMAAVKISSLAHPKEEMGEQAARKLIAMMGGAGETPMMLPWHLVEKEST